MDAIEAINKRRSIRKYTTQQVPREVVEELIRAAMMAPSAGNEQPWHFVIITDRAVLDRIMTIHPHAAMLKYAQTAVLICCDPSREKHKGYWVQDCSAATQNLLLAATAKGLGTVWLGVHPREERVAGLRNMLHLPEQIIPFSLIPIGYPDEEKGPVDRFDPTRIHHNRWQG